MKKTDVITAIRWFLFVLRLWSPDRRQLEAMFGCDCPVAHQFESLHCPLSLAIERAVFERRGDRRPGAAPFEERGTPSRYYVHVTGQKKQEERL